MVTPRTTDPGNERKASKGLEFDSGSSSILPGRWAARPANSAGFPRNLGGCDVHMAYRYLLSGCSLMWVLNIVSLERVDRHAGLFRVRGIEQDEI